MISDFGIHRAYVSVISAGRPDSYGTMSDLMDVAATWYVPLYEENLYEKRGAVTRIDRGSLCGARNAALDDAFEAGVACVQLSDDLTKLGQLTTAGGKAGQTPLAFRAAVTQLLDELAVTDFKLAGVAPTANPFYGSAKPKYRHFIVGDFTVTLPSPERFDQRLKLKEDYDFTAQHIAAYGGVVRADWIMAAFKHRTNPGGAVAFRTAEREQEAIAYLKGKWGPWIRDNPKRPNEILLRA